MRLVGAIAIAVTVMSTAPVLAANARHPHANVDHRVDKGGNTGNSQVEMLNQQQLDSLRGSGEAAGSGALGAPLYKPAAPARPGAIQ